MTDTPAPADATAPVRTGPAPGRARISPPRAPTVATSVAALEPVVEAEPVVPAPEPTPAPAPVTAPKAEPVVAATTGRPVGRLRLSPPRAPVAAPSVVEVAPVTVESTPEPEAVPAAPETPPVEPTPAPRGPAPGRVRLSVPVAAPAHVAEVVAEPVAAPSPSVTRWREATMRPLSELPPVEVDDDAEDDAEDDAGDDAGDDLVLGEPDPVPPPAPVEAAPVRVAPPYVPAPVRHVWRPPSDRAFVGPRLPRDPSVHFIGPSRYGDHCVPF